MSNEHPDVQRLFEEALERSPSERAAFLDDACGSNRELRTRVGALLDALSAADDFLPEQGPSVTERDERPGAVIDRYRLLQRIGEGGFGTVWTAEQTEPVRRKVALKVIKLGMDTRQVVARFEAERQALALMEHPNIAKALDAGTTSGGRAYFVMELVDGVPVTEYCDRARLDVRQRLEVFQQVCNAVQHAHQKGVIHRDLKPSNILVTEHDGVAVPKVIDFGIAKATSAELTRKTMFTEGRQMVGTPEYMAPEQAGAATLDIDTRADVYSLGVLLYELLTGARPFEMRSLMEQGFLEVLRVIREDEPVKPSARVGRPDPQLVATADHRHTSPPVLSRSIRGDLDWIVMKALEKDRARRYATASDLAADIGRHLQDEPVLAGPPTAAYRLRKYVRRHRIGVTAGAAIALSLLVGSGVALWGWADADTQRLRASAAEHDAVTQRDEADAARKRAEEGERLAKLDAVQRKEVIGFIADMLRSANPRRGKGPDYTVRQMLDDYDRALGDRLKDLPAVEAMVRNLMATAYEALGAYEKAGAHAEASLEIWRRLFGPEDRRLVAPLLLLARGLGMQNRLEEAEARLREALALALGQEGEEAQVAKVLGELSEVLLRRNRLQDAERAARQALELSRQLDPDGKDLATAASLEHLGHVLLKMGRFGEAEEALRGVIGIKRAALGDDSPALADSLHFLAWALVQGSKLNEAEPLAREALRIRRTVLGDDNPDVAETLDNLGSCLMGQGKSEEAAEMLREAVRLKRILPGPGSYEFAVSLSNLSQALWLQGKLEEADERQSEALDVRRKVFGEVHPSVAIGLDILGRIRLARGDAEGAEELLDESLRIRQRFFPEDHPQVAMGHLHLGEALLALDKLELAEAEWRKGIDFVRRTLRDRDPTLFATLLGNLGNLLVKRGKHAEAEVVYRECLELCGEKLPDSWLRYQAMSLLGASLLAQGKQADAEPLLLEGHERMEPPAKDRGRRLEALARIVELYEGWDKQVEATEWRGRLEAAEAALEEPHGKQQ